MDRQDDAFEMVAYPAACPLIGRAVYILHPIPERWRDCLPITTGCAYLRIECRVRVTRKKSDLYATSRDNETKWW